MQNEEKAKPFTEQDIRFTTNKGALYALFPDAMKRFMSQVLEQPASALRTAGVLATALGVGIVWVIRK